MKRQVNEARNVCEQPVIPVRTRKLVGEDKAKRGRRKSWDFASGFLTSRFATNELNRELVLRRPVNRGTVRRKSNIHKFLGAVAKIVLRALEAYILSRIMKRLRRGVEVKNGNVGAVAGFRSGEPNGGFVARK